MGDMTRVESGRTGDSKGYCKKDRNLVMYRFTRSTASTCMHSLSVRYMEPFRTSLDILHTYGTHVNMSIFFSDQLQRCLKPRSARRPRSSHRPIHWKTGICTCGSDTQRPTLKRGKSDPAIGQTAPWKMASKAALMPACGEDQQVATPMHQRELSRYSRPRPAAQRWWSSCQSIDDAAHHQPLAATVELLAPTKAATEGEIRKS